MMQKFTTPCFIRKNTPELRKKLEELGYAVMYGYDTGFIITNPEFGVAFLPVGPKVKVDANSNGEYVDCGTNEDLFLAIAALRDDTDKWQWFCDNDFNWKKRFFICKYGTIKEHINKVTDGDCGSYKDYHKATIEELIEHFKN